MVTLGLEPEIWPQSTVSNDTWHQQWDSEMYGNVAALSCWVYLEQDCWFSLGFQEAKSETHLLLSDSKYSARQFQYVGFPIHTAKAILWQHLGALQFNSVQTLPGDTISFHTLSVQSHKTATLHFISRSKGQIVTSASDRLAIDWRFQGPYPWVLLNS